jgi:hypothetical protein
MTTNYGPNPYIPGVRADVFLPDQLIAGHQPVSQPALITGGALLKRGTVLGRITLGKAETPVNSPANAGNGVISAVAVQAGTKSGKYRVVFTGATTANVFDPAGNPMTALSGASPISYVDAQLHFTFTVGANAMAAGDEIDITTAAAGVAYNIAKSGASDGSQTPAAILADDVDASAADQWGGVYVWGEFNQNAVTIDPSLTLQGVTVTLMDAGIYLKPTTVAADPY